MTTIQTTLSHTRNVAFCPLGRLAELASLPDADLYLVQPVLGIFDEYKLVRFTSRRALESFNKKAGLKALVSSKVPKGCAIYRHQIEA